MDKKNGKRSTGLRGSRIEVFAAAMVCLVGLVTQAFASDETPRNEVLEALLSVKAISQLTLSPDGTRVAYELASVDWATDQTTYDIWMLDIATGESTQLTHTPDSEWAPQWHPDGQAIGFLSDRHDTDAAIAQVWMLPLAGGEARRVTDFEESVQDYVFAANSDHLAAVVMGPDPFKAPEEGAAITTAPPIVIDRFAFKEDGEGYLTRGRELYLVTIVSGKAQRLAADIDRPMTPAFSPDGSKLAFVARAGEKPDRGDNFDVYTLRVGSKAAARAVVSSSSALCADERPVWSPDGKLIACTATEYDQDGYFAQYDLVLLNTANRTLDNVTADFDRNVYQPRFSSDGSSIVVSVEDDMMLGLASIDIASGKMQRVVEGKFSVEDFQLGAADQIIALVSQVDSPAAIYAFENDQRRRLSKHNAQLLATHPWQDAQAISFNSPDGTEVHGLLMLPADAKPRQRLPTVLWIHGGPTSQFAYEARIAPQLFAANGYAVVMVNPRGSTGRGLDYAKAIMGAWGSVDVPDVLAAMDHVVEMGVADPGQLVVGGWSYGGMLTNYVIASDQRFRAAVSGASIGNAWAGFGTDMYVHEYLQELGRPWENPEAYNRVSYPFMHADRIKTPTLFMVGERDYNVPLLASEQMYQALRVLEVPTQLVIYPGQGHGLEPPSYNYDSYQRYLDWFDSYLGKG